MKKEVDYKLDPLSILMRHYSGSISYGTNTPESDVDFRGIFLAEEKYKTPFFSINEHEIEDEEDTKLYELDRFVQLCSESKPTYIETLFVDDRFITHRTPAYDYLRKNRDVFITKKLGPAFLHFADGQYRRILGHDKWHNNPQPKERPQMKDFVKLINNFTSDKIFNRDFSLDRYKNSSLITHYGNDIFGMFLLEGKKPFRPDGSLSPTKLEGDSKKSNPDFIVKFNEKEYSQAVSNWKNYWIWVKERNKDRAALEKKNGYDTKHGLHIVRLLRMSTEVLKTGKVNVFRDDADELKDIRFNGTWNLNDIGNFIERSKEEMPELLAKIDIPDECDFEKVAEILVNARSIHKEYVKNLECNNNSYSL